MKDRNKIIGHINTVFTHKRWVAYYCFKCGLYWRGIKHDLSKFSPIEFWESIQYYTGTRSPIDACKEAKGVSYAWMHHKGRNSHHYEYWVDNLDKGGIPVMMPFEDSVEFICDSLGAARAYMGKDFTFFKELKWWMNKLDSNPRMHVKSKQFFTMIFFKLAKNKSNIKNILNKEYMLIHYDAIAISATEDSFQELLNKVKEFIDKEENKDAQRSGNS